MNGARISASQGAAASPQRAEAGALSGLPPPAPPPPSRGNFPEKVPVCSF